MARGQADKRLTRLCVENRAQEDAKDRHPAEITKLKAGARPDDSSAEISQLKKQIKTNHATYVSAITDLEDRLLGEYQTFMSKESKSHNHQEHEALTSLRGQIESKQNTFTE